MRQLPTAVMLLAFTACAADTPVTAKDICPPEAGVAVQVLGSGGPIADDARASTGYIVWLDGRSRVLIDAGGGTFLRFGEARATFDALDFVGLSHFHTDHSADFPALLKSGVFSRRERALVVAGPEPGGPFPGLDIYLASLLQPVTGAYAYLSEYLQGGGSVAHIIPMMVAESEKPVRVLGDDDGDIGIDAMHVPHGIVPAIAFRVRVGGTTLVFASDQNGSDAAFIDFAKNADLLVMHMPIPEGATGGALQLHAKPSRIGDIAAAAGADRLLLSHFMARSLRNFDANVANVKRNFGGKTLIASDLACFALQ